MLRSAPLLLALAACNTPPDPAAKPPPTAEAPDPQVGRTPRPPMTLTYLGVAGWQLDTGDVTILTDPYFSRPDLDQPLVPDAAAIAAHAPARASMILIGHSHVDHLLDAPAVAQRTGAQIMGSISTARVALASGVPADRIIPIQGGEDYDFDEGFSVRVIPSLHSALSDKHEPGGTEIPANPTMPMRFADYAEGGAYAYLVRAGHREVFFLSTANFIEREVQGLHPDVAVIATGLRQEIHDYTCRLVRALHHPPVIFVNHFDDWRAPPPATPTDAPPGEDLQAFIAEVARCSPKAKVIVPRHFAPNVLPGDPAS